MEIICGVLALATASVATANKTASIPKMKLPSTW
jgi:hypothetical protein